jgi:hypothetical protein
MFILPGIILTLFMATGAVVTSDGTCQSNQSQAKVEQR